MEKSELKIIYGNNPKEMVIKVLEETSIGMIWDKSSCIAIKPNLVLAKPHSSGATTSPEIVSGIIEYLQNYGFKNIIIMESSWIGDSTSRAYRVCGYEEISRKYGVQLFDLKKDGYYTHDVKGIKLNICNKVREVDKIINVPVLKGHCQTKITCALKNMKGLIPDSEKRRFHTMGLHKPIAYLNLAVNSDLIIVDGLMGDLNFEEGGNPVEMNRIIAGQDAVLVDAYAAELLGYDIDEIPYITISENIGAGSANLRKASITELNKDYKVRCLKPSRRVEQLSKFIEEDNACSACYGSLIHALDRLDEKGLLGRINDKIYIGQGFKNKKIKGIGIGNCTAGLTKNIRGCPPNAKQIVKEVTQFLNNQ